MSEQSPTIAEILDIWKPGMVWRIDGDDYATLVWEAANPEALPAEQDIRDQAPAVALELAARRRKREAQDILMRDPEAIIRGFEITLRALQAIYSVLTATQKSTITTNFPGVVPAVQTMNARLDEIRAQITD
jgi:hypothetical protein